MVLWVSTADNIIRIGTSMKHKIGKTKKLANTGFADVDEALHQVRAARKLAKKRQTQAWAIGSAGTLLLVGKCRIFVPPGA